MINTLGKAEGDWGRQSRSPWATDKGLWTISCMCLFLHNIREARYADINVLFLVRFHVISLPGLFSFVYKIGLLLLWLLLV